MKIFVLLVITCTMVGSCTCVNKKLGLKDDNILEEGIEKKLKEYTTIDIDLTPDSDEQQ